MNNSVIVHDLGLLEYEEALTYQLDLFNEIVNTKISNRRNSTTIPTKNHLVFVEHSKCLYIG